MLDDTEEITVAFENVEKVVESMGDGLYDNGIMMAAMGAFLRHLKHHPEIMEKRK